MSLKELPSSNPNDGEALLIHTREAAVLLRLKELPFFKQNKAAALPYSDQRCCPPLFRLKGLAFFIQTELAALLYSD